MATYLNRTPSSASNRKTWTYSTWLKRGQIGTGDNVFFGVGAGTVEFGAFFKSDNILEVYQYTSGTYNFRYKTDQLFRDSSAWYHIVIAVDTTQGSAGDRVKIYVNGSQITSFSTNTNPSQNFDTQVNLDTPHKIGVAQYGSGFYLGYMAETILVDGTALTPTSFGETDSTTGIWIPKTFSGSFGTNGFLLAFKNSGALGTDTSGQSNTFTVNSAGTNAQVVDTPNNNFATMNPSIATQGQTPTYSKGNTIVTSTSNGSYGASALSTFAIDSGKWYWETKITGDRNNGIAIGLADATWAVGSATDSWFGGSNLNGYAFQFTNGGQKKVDNGTGTSYGTQIAVNDILGTAYDADNNTITWYINGSSQGQAFSSMRDITFVPASYGYYNTQWEFNFGNPAFTIASGNADANGYGNFEYAVPSGYYALCTKNINQYG
tara:strand:+ start:691 stop:1992 length:1302 start_codon:yes stop_codon:yes gene_type:complete